MLGLNEFHQPSPVDLFCSSNRLVNIRRLHAGQQMFQERVKWRTKGSLHLLSRLTEV